MIVPTTLRDKIHCSPDVLYTRGVMPKTAEIVAMQRIAKERPDLARKVLQGHELTLISGRGDEFTVSVGAPEVTSIECTAARDIPSAQVSPDECDSIIKNIKPFRLRLD